MTQVQVRLALKAAMTTTIFAALSACALMAPPLPPEDVVRQRADTRWQKLLERKLEDAYALTAPSYRAQVPFEKFRATIGGNAAWAGAEVVSVRCEPQTCAVRLKIGAKASGGFQFGGIITTAVDETWTLEDGQWWLSLKP